MNRNFFKVIFSKHLGAWTVVGEIVKSAGKQKSSGLAPKGMSRLWTRLSQTVVATWLALVGVPAWAVDTGALPTGAAVVHGSINHSVSGNTMTITQDTAKAIVNYDSFNIGRDATVNHSGGTMLGRVTGAGATQIDGQLNTSGMVLVNPQGIAIGSTGQVNGGSFTASTLDITNEDFLRGDYRFTAKGGEAGVVNDGTIQVTEGGGYVALIGATVDNSGQIQTAGGAVVMAAGGAATVRVPLSGRVSLELDAADLNASVNNHEHGVIVTNGGQVLMRAAAVVDVVSGTAQAEVKQAGLVDTSGEQGGRVDVLADAGRIEVTGTIKANSSQIDANTAKPAAGGDVYIGRDEITDVLAEYTDVSQATLESRGGFIETSAQRMDINGVDITAGHWLIDPYNIEITDAAPIDATLGYDTTISAATINTALGNGTEVEVNTATGEPASGTALGSATEEGNLLVSTALSSGNGNGNLRLVANNDLKIGATISLAGNLTLVAGNDIEINHDVVVLDADIKAGRHIDINAEVQSARNATIWSAQQGVGQFAEIKYRAGEGAISFGANGSVSFVDRLYMQSGGKLNDSGAAVSVTNPLVRSDIGAGKIIQTVNASATSPWRALLLHGFGRVELPEITLGLVGSGGVSTSDIGVIASSIVLGGNLTATNILLEAASFDKAGRFSGPNEGSGWRRELGQVNQGAYELNFSNSLLLRSGLGDNGSGVSDGNRADFSLTRGDSAPTTGGVYDGSIVIEGFNKVTIDAGPNTISVNTLRVIAQQIDVKSNIYAENTVRLEAASFDPTTAGNPGQLAGNNPPQPTGWRNLDGTVAIESGLEIKANAFILYSGLKADGTRIDLDAGGTLLPVGANTVTRFDVAGYNTVTLPTNITSLTGEAVYRVIAQNINGADLKSLNANSVRMDAGRFTAGVNGKMVFPLTDQFSSNNGVSWSAPAGQGHLTLYSGFVMQANAIDLTSGVSAGGRADLNFAAIRPYNVNDIDQVQPFGSPGRGFYMLSLQGFNDVKLPGHAIKSEIVDIAANHIHVYDDINAGGGGWWPVPYYLYLQAGAYGAGQVTFHHPTDRKIVLRANAYRNGENETGRGFHGQLTVLSKGGTFDALLGYKNDGYTAGGKGAYQALRIEGFDVTNLQHEDATQTISVVQTNFPRFAATGGTIRVIQNPGSTGWITVHNDLSAVGSITSFQGATREGITLDAANGGVRMGSNVATAPRLRVVTGKDSAVNSNVNELAFASKGGTLVVNEANNLSVIWTGADNDAGSIEINTRGQLSLASNLSRTNPNSSVTLRADAAFGKQIKVDEETFDSAAVDLNTLFESHNQNIYGELGGDGAGSISVSAASGTVVIPVFRRLAIAEVDFTVPAGGNYFDANGDALATGTSVSPGTVVQVRLGVSLPAALDTLTTTGQPVRGLAKVGQGGYTIQPGEANKYYKLENDKYVAYTVGAQLGSGLVVYYKPDVGVASALQIVPNGVTNGEMLYVVGGYQAGPLGSVRQYKSLGIAKDSLGDFGYSGGLSGIVAPNVSGDTDVVDVLVHNKYGNPLSGTTVGNNLNMSGQFYTVTFGEFESAPTMFNGLADNGGSLSGNGWDKSWNTTFLSTNGGNLSLFSGERHALEVAGAAQRDPSDLTVFTNSNVSDFSKTKDARVGAANLSSGSGDLVVLGFRDVTVQDPGSLSSTGNVTIGAARDLVLNADVQLGGNNSLTTLMAGGMVTNTNGIGGYHTVTGERLLVVAGGGVDLKTDIKVLAGSLQDQPNVPGGVTSTGRFTVINDGPLEIGKLTNSNVNDVTFTKASGIQYRPDTALERDGIYTDADGDGYGAVNIRAEDGDLTLKANVNASQSPSAKGDVTLTAVDGDLKRVGDTNLVTGRNVVLDAQAGVIGTSGVAIMTEADTLKLTSNGAQFVVEQSDVILAAQTTDGSITVTAGHQLTAGAASGLSGVVAGGTGDVALTGANVVIAQAVTASADNVTLTATTGDITRDGNFRVTGANVVLDAQAGVIGALDTGILTDAHTLKLDSKGDQFVDDQGDVVLASSTSDNGQVVVTAVGDLTVGRVGTLLGVTTGSGNITLSAGTKRVAGDGTGGQLKVDAAANSPSLLNTTGSISLFTGNSTDTGNLSELEGSLANLYLWDFEGNSVNSRTNTAYQFGSAIPNGANVQVNFREVLSLNANISDTLEYTYGVVDQRFDLLAALMSVNTLTNFDIAANAGTFKYTSENVYSLLQSASVANATWSSSDHHLAANQNAYDISVVQNAGTGFDVTGVSGTVQINRKSLSVSYDANDKLYDGTTVATVSATSNEIIGDDAVSFSFQSADFSDPSVGSNKDVFVTGISLSGWDSGNYELSNTQFIAQANIFTDPNSPEPFSPTPPPASPVEPTQPEGQDLPGFIRPDNSSAESSNQSGNSNVTIADGEAGFALASADEERACSVDQIENCFCETPKDELGKRLEWMEVCYPEDQEQRRVSVTLSKAP